MFKKLFLSAILAGFAMAAVNINTATKEELMSLKGIGEAKAKAIIEYRSKNKFNSIEDLKNVPGIGEKRFEALKDELSTTGQTSIKQEAKKAKQATQKGKKDAKEKGAKEAKDAKEKGAKSLEKAKLGQEKEIKKAKDLKAKM